MDPSKPQRMGHTMGEHYLTLAQLRRKLGNRGRSSVYNDLAAKRLPEPIRLGGRLLWSEREVDEHMAALRAGASAEVVE